MIHTVFSLYEPSGREVGGGGGGGGAVLIFPCPLDWTYLKGGGAYLLIKII